MISLIEKIKIYLRLLLRRDWRAINYRLQFLFRKIDLENVYVEELNLSAERSHYYSDSGGTELEKVLDRLKITSQDTIVDFGSGKGGALITLAKYPFSKITGVEISDKLIKIAQRNLRKLWIDNVNLVLSDAVEFTELDDYNYVYFFNPFPCIIKQSVIENLKISLTRKPRKITIIYLNPICHDAVVTDTPFIKQEEIDHPSLKYFIYSNNL
jgi:SAM-dependent methyltransferase